MFFQKTQQNNDSLEADQLLTQITETEYTQLKDVRDQQE